LSKHISSLDVIFNSTVAPFANGLKAGERAVTGFIGKIGEAGTKLLEFTGIGAIAGAAIASIFEIGKGFGLASQFETANVQLNALTGSAQIGTAVLGQLRDFAKSSPFEFPELLDASKKLLAVGVSAGNIAPLLKTVGEVSAGTGVEIGGIADIFARVANEGKLGSRELLEFGRQGIPVVQELAKEFHTTAAGVDQMAEAGQIGFKQLQDAFNAMTGPGGRFNGILAAQGNTIGGVFRNLSVTVEDASADIAENLIRAFNITGLLPRVTSTISSIGEVIASGVTTYAPYVIRFAHQAVQAFEWLYQQASPVITRIETVVAGVWGGITALVTTYGGTIVNAALTVFNQVLDFARPIWNALYETIATNWQSILATTVSIAVAIYDLVATVWNTTVQLAYTIWGSLTGAFTAGWTAIFGASAQGANDTRSTFQSVIDVVQWLGTAFTTVIESVSYGIQNFSTLVQLIGVGVALRFVTMGNEVAYVFTGIIWPAIQWISSQLFDFVRWTGNVFSNLGSNIVAVFSNLPGLIRGSVKFGDIWTPLTEGFKSEAQSWPGIAARVAGPLEKGLTDQFNQLSDKFGTGLGDHLANNTQKAAAIVKTTTKGITSAIDKATKPEKIEVPKIPKPDPLKLDASINPQNLSVGITPEIKHAQAIRSGSAASLSARVIPIQRILGTGAIQGAIPLAQNPAARQQGQQQQANAPAAHVPGVAAANNGDAKEDWRKANEWLYRIEFNTRPLQQNQTQTVSI
jgi:tape measure domain-containing protein